MKSWNALLLCAALAAPALAEDPAAPAFPDVDAPAEAAAPKASPAAETAAVPAPAPAAAVAEPAAPVEAPAAEAAKKDEPKAAGAPKPKPRPKPLSPEERLQAEWQFLSTAAQDPNGDISEAAVDDLRAFTERYPDAEMRPDALFLAASLRQKRGDVKGGLVDFLRIVYEYPDSKLALKAKSAFLEGAARKLPGRLKVAESDLVKTPQSDDKTERMALLIEKLATAMEDSLYDTTVEEVRRFQIRFPDYPASDKIQWSLGQLHEKAGKSGAALLAYRELMSVYPDSALLPDAQFTIGSLYADSLRDYKQAIDAFLEVVDKYPDSPKVQQALQRAAQLYSDRLKQYELAVELDQKIVKLFPKTDAALKAYKDAATLQRERLRQPGDAIKTDQGEADMFPSAAVEALLDAATIARKDLTDYKQEIEIRHGIAKNYASVKEAPEQLFEAGYVAENDLKDPVQAAALYKELQTIFPSSKQAKKAGDRQTKLSQKR